MLSSEPSAPALYFHSPSPPRTLEELIQETCHSSWACFQNETHPGFKQLSKLLPGTQTQWEPFTRRRARCGLPLKLSISKNQDFGCKIISRAPAEPAAPMQRCWVLDFHFFSHLFFVFGEGRGPFDPTAKLSSKSMTSMYDFTSSAQEVLPRPLHLNKYLFEIERSQRDSHLSSSGSFPKCMQC